MPLLYNYNTSDKYIQLEIMLLSLRRYNMIAICMICMCYAVGMRQNICVVVVGGVAGGGWHFVKLSILL